MALPPEKKDQKIALAQRNAIIARLDDFRFGSETRIDYKRKVILEMQISDQPLPHSTFVYTQSFEAARC